MVKYDPRIEENHIQAKLLALKKLEQGDGSTRRQSLNSRRRHKKRGPSKRHKTEPKVRRRNTRTSTDDMEDEGNMNRRNSMIHDYDYHSPLKDYPRTGIMSGNANRSRFNKKSAIHDPFSSVSASSRKSESSRSTGSRSARRRIFRKRPKKKAKRPTNTMPGLVVSPPIDVETPFIPPNNQNETESDEEEFYWDSMELQPLEDEPRRKLTCTEMIAKNAAVIAGCCALLFVLSIAIFMIIFMYRGSNGCLVIEQQCCELSSCIGNPTCINSKKTAREFCQVREVTCATQCTSR